MHREVIYSKENCSLPWRRHVQKGYGSKGRVFFFAVRGLVNKKHRLEFVSVCKVSSKEWAETTTQAWPLPTSLLAWTLGWTLGQEASGNIAHSSFFPASSSLQLGNPGRGSPLVLIDLHPRSLWLRPCIPNGHCVVLGVIYPPKPKWALCPCVVWCTHNWEIQFFTWAPKFH